MYDMSSFLQANKYYEENTPVQAKMAKQLLDLLCLDFKEHDFGSVFEFGAGAGRLFYAAKARLQADSFLASDINDFSSFYKNDEFFLHDMNWPNPFCKRFDLVISNACFQWLDADTGLDNIASFLKPGGVMAITSFGPDNLWQIKELSGAGLSYLSIEELKQKLASSFDIKLFKATSEQLSFNTPKALLKHLRNSGVNALKPDFYLGKEALKTIEKKYKNTIFYQPIYIIARLKK